MKYFTNQLDYFDNQPEYFINQAEYFINQPDYFGLIINHWFKPTTYLIT